MFGSRRSRQNRMMIAPFARLGLLIAIALTACACASAPNGQRASQDGLSADPMRTFDRSRDTFGYTNNNLWRYEFGPNNEMHAIKRRLGKVEHGQRCTIMARTARQFFYQARFEPSLPKLSDSEYRRLIRRVIDANPRNDVPSADPVLIPGYGDLRAFSLDREGLVKDEIAGRLVGYFQRGNWRMIFPFTPNQQRSTANALLADLARGHLPLVHIANFPRININHTGLIFDVTESPTQIRFAVYDPNSASETRALLFDRASASFRYSRTDYFAGGTAKVYRIYDDFLF